MVQLCSKSFRLFLDPAFVWRTKCPPLRFSLRYSCDHLSESNWTLHTSLTELTNLCEQPGQQPKSTRTQTYKKVRREQTSMDMMENATQRLQTGLGIKMKLTTIMKADVTNTDWIDWKEMVKQWSLSSQTFQNSFILLPVALFPSTGRCRWSRGGTPTPGRK